MTFEASDHHATLTLFSVASTHYVVSIYDEVQSSLEARGVRVEHIGLATDQWYAGNAYLTYQRSHVIPYYVDRQKGATSVWWHDKNIKTELQNNLGNIRHQMLCLIQQYKPHVFMIDDDEGPLEVFLMHIFRECRVPILLFEHGYGFAIAQLQKLTSSPTAVARSSTAGAQSKSSLPRKLAQALRAKFVAPLPEISTSLPKVLPFGHNGSDMICCLSEFTRDVHLRSGISPSELCVTGNPYLDKLVRNHHTPARRTSDDRPKSVLIVSTGYGKFGFTSEYEAFMETVVSLCQELRPTFEVSLRLKQGEDTAVWERYDYSRSLQDLGVELDDNRILFHKSLARYDLTICDPESLAILECILSGVPVTKIMRSSASLQSAESWLVQIYDEQIGVTTLADLERTKQTIEDALDPNYINCLRKNLMTNAGYNLGVFDGNAGTKVAQVLVDLAQRNTPGMSS